MVSFSRMEYGSCGGFRRPSPGLLRVWRQPGEAGVRAPLSAVAYELGIGPGRIVCGCVPVNKGALSWVESRAAKMTLMGGLLGDSFTASAYCDRSRRPLTIEIEADSLGKPAVRINGVPGPPISFSLGAGVMWAAVCREGACGIDSAQSGEFNGSYPFHRAFHDTEFPAIMKLTAEDRQEAAAIIWSAKEAAVKALGCGFHLLDPLDVQILPLRTGSGGLMSKAVITGSFPRKYGRGEEIFVPVLTFRFNDSWVSAAFSGAGPS